MGKPSLFNYEIADGKVEITECSKDAKGAVVIPEAIEGHPVTDIRCFAFPTDCQMESVTLPTSMAKINESAFNGCGKLKSVKIPSSVTSIGNRAFACCFLLESVTIPQGVTSIGDYAFYRCGLKSVKIPASVTSIGELAFQTLEFVVDPANKVYSSKNGMLLSKDGKTLIAGVRGKAVIPDGVTHIAENAFSECQGLKSLKISASAAEKKAFSKCCGLESVKIPASVKIIDARAFYKCSELKSVTIPDGVETIGKEAFFFCKKLSSVVIGKGVTSIGADAFNRCNFKSITIPEGVKSVGKSAFSTCPLLESLTISPGVKKIGSRAFATCRSLTSVTIPASVTSLAADAFLRHGSPVKVVVESHAKKEVHKKEKGKAMKVWLLVEMDVSEPGEPVEISVWANKASAVAALEAAISDHDDEDIERDGDSYACYDERIEWRIEEKEVCTGED